MTTRLPAHDELLTVHRAAETLATARAALRIAVHQALDAGAIVTEVANVAGVSRQTIYTWSAHRDPEADSPEDEATTRAEQEARR